jgi:hypothetical protein
MENQGGFSKGPVAEERDDNVIKVMKMVENLSNKMQPMIESHSQAISKLDLQMRQLVASLNERERRRLPQQAEPNPNIHANVGGTSTNEGGAHHG